MNLSKLTFRICPIFRLRFLYQQKSLFLSMLLSITISIFIIFLYLEVENAFAQLCWQNQMIGSKHSDKDYLNKIEKKFIPSSVSDAPVDLVPTIPDTFIIEEKNYCERRPHLKVIAYVHSAIKNTEKRQTTRETWASASEAIGTVFFVGKAKSPEEELIILKESSEFGDIVQGNYTDLYELLVYKALNALLWVNKNCIRVPWVLHADDDIILDVFYLLKVLTAFEKEGNEDDIFCHKVVKAKPRRSGKWKVKMHEYPCEFYPPYCSGPCWFTSIRTINRLLLSVPMVKYLWVDDTYLTGLLAEHAKIKRAEVPMKDDTIEEQEIGNKIAWFHIVSDRNYYFNHIVKYHNLSTASDTKDSNKL